MSRSPLDVTSTGTLVMPTGNRNGGAVDESRGDEGDRNPPVLFRVDKVKLQS